MRALVAMMLALAACGSGEADRIRALEDQAQSHFKALTEALTRGPPDEGTAVLNWWFELARRQDDLEAAGRAILGIWARRDGAYEHERQWKAYFEARARAKDNPKPPKTEGDVPPAAKSGGGIVQSLIDLATAYGWDHSGLSGR